MTPGDRTPRFEDLTETTGVPLTEEGAVMLYTRYALAARMSRGRRVLELGCGAGQGLGLLGRSAAWVVGADYSMPLLRTGRHHYSDRFPLVRLSADALPFRGGSFDLVFVFEASYYVPDMNRAFDEIARVLDPAGSVLFVNANPERPDFIRSPHSVHYHSADEFRAGLERRGFDVTIEGAFAVDGNGSWRSRLVGGVLRLARRLLESLHLVPRTLRGRAQLKRLIYGRLREVPPELTPGFAAEGRRIPLAGGPVRGAKVLYVTGRKPGALRFPDEPWGEP